MGIYQYTDSIVDNDSDDNLVQIYLRTSLNYRIYSREPYGLLEYLGDLGGLFDFLFMIGFIMIGASVDSSFTRNLLN